MKKTTLIKRLLLSGLLLISLGSFRQGEETVIEVAGIRSAKGNLILNVFKNQETFNNQQPFKQLTFDKKSLANGSVTIRLKLEAGNYGITLIDDENQNGKIDKNIIGIPKEGFGFSNFLMEKLKKPSFNDFKVNIPSAKAITIQVKYM